MTKAQKELIREAYAKEVDGEGWRKRMERWLAAKYTVLLKLSPARVIGKGTRVTVTYTQP